MSTLQIHVWNRVRPAGQAPPHESHDFVSGCELVLNPLGGGLIGPAHQAPPTDRRGRSAINLAHLRPGLHTLHINPPDADTNPVGPDTAEGVPFAALQRVYRPLVVQLHVRDVGGGQQRVAAAVHIVTLTNGVISQHGPDALTLRVELQPVFCQITPKPARNPAAIDMIVIHRFGTGDHAGNTIGNFFDEPGTAAGAHYLVGLDPNPLFDGFVVKLTRNNTNAQHTGNSYWGGARTCNTTSIGIEVACRFGQEYTAAQMRSLLALLARLAQRHRVPRHRIVGHSDINLHDGSQHRLGRKSRDPGLEFDWPRLDREGFGLQRGGGTAAPTFPPVQVLYTGFFHTFPTGSLGLGDRDGVDRLRGIAPVQALKQYLHQIGYSVGTVNGDYDDVTESAVRMFQEHFFAGPAPRTPPNGRVNRETANLIFNVWSSNPTYP